MSLYREAGRARRNRRIAIGAGIAAIVLIALIVVLATSGGPPSHADRVKSAKSAAGEALDGIEVLTVEYGQAVRGGRVVAPTEYGGAKGDVQRARASLTDHRADFEATDPAAYRRSLAALDALAATVARRADIAAAVRATRAALQPFTA
jgi:hypothetical protein